MSDTDDENVNDDDAMMVENNNDDEEEEEENEEETTWELSELPKKERDIIDKFHHGKMANGLMTQDVCHLTLKNIKILKKIILQIYRYI
jgi:DNA-directed RNA polymerase specialized sigma subunit